MQCVFFGGGYVARKRALAARSEIWSETLRLQKGAENASRKSEAAREAAVERRINPKSAQDFEVLYSDLETGVTHTDVSRNCRGRRRRGGGVTDEQRKALTAGLLARETKPLQTIDKLKARALKSGRVKKVQRMTTTTSEPKEWESGGGTKMKVDTHFTKRARGNSQTFTGVYSRAAARPARGPPCQASRNDSTSSLPSS